MDRDEQEGVDKQAGEGEEESEGDETEEEQGGQEEPSVEEQCVSLLVCGCEREGNFLSSVGVRTRGGLAEHAKDPGIPNSFPYKDQILAEVAEERRLVCGISRCTACLVLTGYAGGIRLQRRSRSARMRRGRPRRRPQKMARTRMRSCLTA